MEIKKNIKAKYFNLCYNERIHEFSKIDSYKNWSKGTARSKYKTLEEFYMEELNANKAALVKLKDGFKEYHSIYTKYFNTQRAELFSSPEKLLKWYHNQNESCRYCGVTQKQLIVIVLKRRGNLTLNQKTKRSKGTLEIEKRDPNLGYTFENSVLACPFCNNAKSNLISEKDWVTFFKPAMQSYIHHQLCN